MNETYATESKAYDAEMTVRKAPLQTSLQELENALMKLGEVSQRYLTATESVRRMSPTAETERGDVDKPHHSSLTNQIDRYIGMVNTFTFSIDSAQAELEL